MEKLACFSPSADAVGKGYTQHLCSVNTMNPWDNWKKLSFYIYILAFKLLYVLVQRLLRIASVRSQLPKEAHLIESIDTLLSQSTWQSFFE